MNVTRFLAAHRVARLATITPGGRPHIVPVVYASKGKLIYIALDEKRKRVAPMRLQRVRNIAANPRVSLLVDRYAEDWRKLAWVRLDGIARIVPRGREHQTGIKVLRDKYPQYRKMKLESRPLIEITIERVVQWQPEIL